MSNGIDLLITHLIPISCFVYKTLDTGIYLPTLFCTDMMLLNSDLFWSRQWKASIAKVRRYSLQLCPTASLDVF